LAARLQATRVQHCWPAQCRNAAETTGRAVRRGSVPPAASMAQCDPSGCWQLGPQGWHLKLMTSSWCRHMAVEVCTSVRWASSRMSAMRDMAQQNTSSRLMPTCRSSRHRGPWT
jgi:hypothetical protein